MKFKRRTPLHNQRGQTMIEYILLMAIVVGGIIFVTGKLKESQFFFKKFTSPLVKHLTYNYKYGDPKSQGWDEGQPRLHIQISQPAGTNFRMFQPER